MGEHVWATVGRRTGRGLLLIGVLVAPVVGCASARAVRILDVG